MTTTENEFIQEPLPFTPENLVELYSAGNSVQKIAKLVGRSSTGVYYKLVECGVVMRPQHKPPIPPAIVEEMAVKYRTGGTTLYRLSRQYKISTTAISRAFFLAGVWCSKRPYNDVLRGEAMALWESGESIAEIARRQTYPYATVYRWLHREELSLEAKSERRRALRRRRIDADPNEPTYV